MRTSCSARTAFPERFACCNKLSFDRERKPMNYRLLLTLAASGAALVLAQGPPPGHRPGGFGPPHELMWAGPGSHTPVTGAPYSAVETRQVQQTLADGNQISHQDQSKVY